MHGFFFILVSGLTALILPAVVADLQYFLKEINKNPDCPRHLRDWMELEDQSLCPPPPLQHQPPGAKKDQAPEAICAIAEASGLPRETVYFPYKNFPFRGMRCH